MAFPVFELAGRVGRIAQLLGLSGPTAQEVGAVFADLSTVRRRQVARAIAAQRFSNALLRRVVARVGIEAFARRVRCEGESQFIGLAVRRHPVVLVPWHCGPVHAISPALIKLGVPALVVRHEPQFEAAQGIEYVYSRGHDAVGSRALKRATEILRKGGVVVMPAGVPSVPFELPPGPYHLFGRSAHLFRGPAVLARLGGAEVIPVVPRWRGEEVVVGFAAPIPRPAFVPGRGVADAFDSEFVSSLAGWWERYLREHPEDMWILSLRAIARMPRAPSS